MAHDSYGPVDGVVAQIEAQQCQVRAFQSFAQRTWACAALGKRSAVTELRHEGAALDLGVPAGCGR